METAILLSICYLSGAIPFSWVVSKWYGINPRTSGSGATGATQILRLLTDAGVHHPGKKFALGLALDGFKAFFPVLVVVLITDSKLVEIAAAGVVCFGHTRSVWLLLFDRDEKVLKWSLLKRLRGGKSVSTALGVTAALAFSEPAVALVLTAAVTLFAAGLLLSGWKMSVGSLTGTIAGVVTLVLVFAMDLVSTTYLFGLLGIAAFIIIMHWDNIKRILEGTEKSVISRREGTT